MRVGIFGGTFDPVHLGHLILAEQCREQARLDQIWFTPAARPPHKLDRSLTPFHQRVDMLAIAIAGHPAFRVEELEKDRPGPSYTVDTLEALHCRRPEVELFLILGSDSLPELPHWREPARIVALAELLIVPRPGWPVPSAEQLRAALNLPEETPLRFQVVDSPFIDMSSNDIRCRVRQGRSVRYLLPRAVGCYIENHGLYKA